MGYVVLYLSMAQLYCGMLFDSTYNGFNIVGLIKKCVCLLDIRYLTERWQLAIMCFI